jgi:hypothetical protein
MTFMTDPDARVTPRVDDTVRYANARMRPGLKVPGMGYIPGPGQYFYHSIPTQPRVPCGGHWPTAT